MSREMTWGQCLRMVLTWEARGTVLKIVQDKQVVGKDRGARAFGHSGAELV